MGKEQGKTMGMKDKKVCECNAGRNALLAVLYNVLSFGLCIIGDGWLHERCIASVKVKRGE